MTGQDTEMLRRRWPEVLETVKGLRRASWILVGQNAQVQGLDASVLVLSFPTQGLVDRFRDHADVIARAVRETLGFDVHVQATVGGASAASSGAGTTTAPTPATSRTPVGGTPAARPARGRGIPSAEEAAASWDAPARPSSGGKRSSAPDASGSSEAGGSGSSAPGPSRSSTPGAPGSSAQGATGSSSATRSAAGRMPADEGASDPAPGPRPVPDDDLDDPPIDPPDDELPDDLPPEEPAPTADPGPDEPSDDDPVIEGSNLVGAPLVARLLGGTVIDEQVDGPAI